MADVDMAFEDLSTVEPDRFLQRYALAVLYFSTGGEESWIDQASFLTPDRHECEWFVTTPEGQLSVSGFLGISLCSEERRVQWIELSEYHRVELSKALSQELVYKTCHSYHVLTMSFCTPSLLYF